MGRVRFILGRSGSGKTHHCLEAVRAGLRDRPQDGPPLVLLVPEQATFQIERALVETPGLDGWHRARVLSFQRFARLLFNELGGPADEHISPLGKQMALRAVLADLGDRLPTFAASIGRTGFVARLAGTFREFHQYQVSADDLRDRARAESNARLARKLDELAIAFDAFNAFLLEQHFTDPDAALTQAAAQLPASRLACGARVWIDGFAGFTPQELDFLVRLAPVADAVEIALVLDPADTPRLSPKARTLHVAPGRLFRRTETTLLQLQRLFADKGVEVAPPLLMESQPRFDAVPPLATLERDMFATRVHATAPPAPSAESQPSAVQDPQASHLLARRDDALLLVEAPDRRAEVRAAVAQVRHLVAACGYRYRDVAVIFRSLEEYWQLVVEAFEDAGVPFFIDRRQPIAHHPLVELLRSAVGSLARRLATRDVIAFLKTDLPAAVVDGRDVETRDAIDRLENYALAYGLAGPAWFAPAEWDFHKHTAFGQEDLGEHGEPAGFADMVRVAEQGLAPLRVLHQAVADAQGVPTARQWARLLWQLLATLDVERTLAGWADADGGQRGVHGQALGAVTDLLRDLAVALGDRRMAPPELVEVLEAGLSQLTLGLVPPALDQVLVGAIERSRHPTIRAALVMGMTERTFPQTGPVQAILTDEDRRRLAGRSVLAEMPPPDDAGDDRVPAIELAPGRSETLFDEDLMAYLAMTRPGERLWVSYPAADEAGKPLRPSRYVRRLRQLMPDLSIVRLADEPPPLLAISPAELAGCLAGEFARSQDKKPPSLEANLYELLRDAAPAALAAAGSLAYANEPALGEEAARRLFTRRGRLAGSVTRLESFGACPFQHFAGHGLRLEPREQIELDALQLGRFYHELLRQMFERLGGDAGPVRWADAREQDLRDLAAELVAAARRDLTLPGLAGGAQQYILSRAEQVLGDLATALRAASAVAPDMQQVAAELMFSNRPESELEPLTLDLAGRDKLLLRGVIDRIDVASDGATFVVDYKTGGRTLDWTHLYHGLSLQLLGYLLVLEQNHDAIAARAGVDAIRPAGAFFQRITVGSSTGGAPDGDEPSERERHAAYQRRGLFDAEAAGLLDADLGPGETSPFVKLKLNKDGSPSAASESVDADALAALMRWTGEKMAEHGRAILSGRVAVEPYRIRTEGPCGWCNFRRVCRLDFDYNSPRYLERMKPADVLGEVGA